MSLPTVSLDVGQDPRDVLHDGHVDAVVVAGEVPVGDDAVDLEVAFADCARRGAGVAETGAALLGESVGPAGADPLRGGLELGLAAGKVLHLGLALWKRERG